jgi:hypothetical protein
VTATLDAKYMAERVVVKKGATITEFTYGDYQDWNKQLNKIEAFYAGKIVERRNWTVVRDLTTVETETGQVWSDTGRRYPANQSDSRLRALFALAVRAVPSSL